MTRGIDSREKKEREKKIRVGENKSVREREGKYQVCIRRVRMPAATASGASSLVPMN